MGPLKGLEIIEIAGMGPGPFCGMMLADMGATVISISRPGTRLQNHDRVLFRGRHHLSIDLKSPAGIEALLKLCQRSHAIYEGFRPGVAERLGFGPERCLEINPKIVYGRMTGWGQKGPLSQKAGHDINYIALSGVLHAMGQKDGKPIPPLNLVGDFGGGGIMLAFGLISAIWEASQSGQGQVIDCSMVEGSSLLMAMFAHGLKPRGTNLLDGGAPFYNTYQTKDAKFIAIGALEPKFYQNLVEKIQWDQGKDLDQYDKNNWELMEKEFSRIFATRTRDEWCEIFQETDACFSPVLTLEEAPSHPHHLAREAYTHIDGVMQPNPTPRFSKTPGGEWISNSHDRNDMRKTLLKRGFDQEQIQTLLDNKVIGQIENVI